MPVDLTKYKVVHKDNVLRALYIAEVIFAPNQSPDPTNPRAPKSVMPETLVLAIINRDGNLVYVTDKARNFQFIPDLRGEAPGA